MSDQPRPNSSIVLITCYNQWAIYAQIRRKKVLFLFLEKAPKTVLEGAFTTCNGALNRMQLNLAKRPYNHCRYAGNNGDVWKHFLLLEVLNYIYDTDI